MSSNLDEEIKKQFGSWTAFSVHLGKNPKNFKRTFTGLIVKINGWLSPLDLEIKIVYKQSKNSSK